MVTLEIVEVDPFADFQGVRSAVDRAEQAARDALLREQAKVLDAQKEEAVHQEERAKLETRIMALETKLANKREENKRLRAGIEEVVERYEAKLDAKNQDNKELHQMVLQLQGTIEELEHQRQRNSKPPLKRAASRSRSPMARRIDPERDHPTAKDVAKDTSFARSLSRTRQAAAGAAITGISAPHTEVKHASVSRSPLSRQRKDSPEAPPACKGSGPRSASHGSRSPDRIRQRSREPSHSVDRSLPRNGRSIEREKAWTHSGRREDHEGKRDDHQRRREENGTREDHVGRRADLEPRREDREDHGKREEHRRREDRSGRCDDSPGGSQRPPRNSRDDDERGQPRHQLRDDDERGQSRHQLRSRSGSRGRERQPREDEERGHGRSHGRDERGGGGGGRNRSRDVSRPRRSRSPWRNSYKGKGKGEGRDGGKGKGNGFCLPYVLGKCAKGDRCYDSHPMDEAAKQILERLKSKPCRWEGQCRRADCIFKHPNDEWEGKRTTR